MSDCAARPRSAARCCVLSRPDSATIGPPCVLAAHSPIAPGRRTSLCESLLVGEERQVGLALAAQELEVDLRAADAA
jgi:hypothetical protein